MSSNVSVCDMSPEVVALLKKFKLRKEKNVAAIVLKIDKTSLKIVLDEEYENISVSDLQDELPPQQPRYVCLSYVQNHDDGRVSYPLIFIFISPQGCSPEQQMMYAGSKTKAVKDGDFTKVIELRSLDELTDETILDKLKKK
ncbi:glia maturation factor beta-like [Physella acuta]|uniref:glia maturation factor beta-like n=1 Tax=Physella acuta TaxID=109671 RepID=UPI0027DD92C7|nr:glia maturation factor beta-like [Physella acuta]